MKRKYGHTIKKLFSITAILSTVLIIGGIFCIANDNLPLGVAQTAIGLAFISYYIYFRADRNKRIAEFLNNIPDNVSRIRSNVMESFPMPMIIVHTDGTLKWFNDSFESLFPTQELFTTQIEKLIPKIKWVELLKHASQIDMEVEISEKKYHVIGRMLGEHDVATNSDEDALSIYMYFIDCTNEHLLSMMYQQSKTDVAIINIDNFDELMQRINDGDMQKITSQLARCINKLASADSNAVVKKLDRDRYFFIFEHKYLEKYIEERFKILDDARNIGEELKTSVSLTIGIGTGSNIKENEAFARSALDMALGRGGDQACIKDENQFSFYGAKNKEYEKSSRVKTRSVALAIKDFITQSENVVFVGHTNADYDCFGAAIGLQRAVRALGKNPYIIYDRNSPAILQMYEEALKSSEYHGMFISAEEALEILEDNTLLVIIDTHRPSLLPHPDLIKVAQKTILIDHHRRSTEFINPCSLIYHEAYASSACEMVTELIEYMNVGKEITKFEANCLYTGILVDTKNFMLKTGVRTFEAASYLKRLGLNTVDVKRMFNIDKNDYDLKADIVKTATEVTTNIAVAYSEKSYPNIKVIASQAADEMLNLNTIKASFVLFPLGDIINISARSLGDINVHLIMEELGGGGHMTVSGAQLETSSIKEATERLKQAINKYMDENAN